MPKGSRREAASAGTAECCSLYPAGLANIAVRQSSQPRIYSSACSSVRLDKTPYSSKSVAVLRRVFDRLEVSARSYDSDFARIWKTFLTAKGESNQCIVGTRPCCHDDELATRPCAVCHRNSVIRI